MRTTDAHLMILKFQGEHGLTDKDALALFSRFMVGAELAKIEGDCLQNHLEIFLSFG